MKKLILGLSLMLFSISTFAGTTNKNVVKSTFNKACGVCHIRIYQGGELVGSWDLPCNSAADCKQMLKDTIAAM
ncbi:hypothetical protein B0A58_05860 [Flavobacterium branchiophilum NBRC 15030 = ATCC 35035]|uniref:Cytochrome c domain-containing protein n=1 Tax=Flavobacterium branchiophilum TaxID=55197 RepID=A0A543G0N7_9FLAO|nr:hypothetical protein [Flavobacterium branchiophilum]OXA77190.1 hypothetical protein B0A58_05860 [Flavobacterium branchiophilum NBRC 15030 = ATCC 35035]TQM39633.1 hypothetical protein BC670_0449 [Flavobacterium branchiophilum]GEM56728.1 hypothetical protein FB1_29490 [Flavobacterium branchiophilum NBRC 15030 = ATCC 35035]